MVSSDELVNDGTIVEESVVCGGVGSEPYEIEGGEFDRESLH